LRTFGEAVAQLQGAEAGGFNFSPAQAALLLNEGVERFAARSEWIRAERNLGPTVAGQEEYSLDDEIVKVKGLEIAGVPYTAVDVLTVWQYKQFGLPPQMAGAYAERFNEDGKIRAIGLLPVPEEDGQPILSLAVLLPGELTAEDELPFPLEFRRGPLDYAKGIAYEDVDENPESGRFFIERANAKADELRELGNSRLGSGPYRIPVATVRR
jgi:hypothetical protein